MKSSLKSLAFNSFVIACFILSGIMIYNILKYNPEERDDILTELNKNADYLMEYLD